MAPVGRFPGDHDGAYPRRCPNRPSVGLGAGIPLPGIATPGRWTARIDVPGALTEWINPTSGRPDRRYEPGATPDLDGMGIGLRRRGWLGTNAVGNHQILIDGQRLRVAKKVELDDGVGFGPVLLRERVDGVGGADLDQHAINRRNQNLLAGNQFVDELGIRPEK